MYIKRNEANEDVGYWLCEGSLIKKNEKAQPIKARTLCVKENDAV